MAYFFLEAVYDSVCHFQVQDAVTRQRDNAVSCVYIMYMHACMYGVMCACIRTYVRTCMYMEVSHVIKMAS